MAALSDQDARALCRRLFAAGREPEPESDPRPGGPPTGVHEVQPGWGDLDVRALEILRSAPVWMTRAERLLLYTLAFSLRPKRYLEIGTFRGGSALLVAAALDATGCDGRLVCVDPEPQISPEDWKRLEPRSTLVVGRSPEILPQAQEAAGGPFDLILIDGDHTSAGVARDATGVLPFAADRAHLLFHDSYNAEIAAALRDFAADHASEVVDFGPLTREVTVDRESQPDTVYWGGLRMMQVRRRVAFTNP